MSAKDKLKESLRARMKESHKRKDDGSGSSYVLSGSNVKWFKPKPGDECVLDIIPYPCAGENGPIDDHGKPKNPVGEGAYVLEFWQHQQVGADKKGKCVCMAKTWSKPCPVCEDIEKMRKQDVDYDDIKIINPKPRCAYNIIAYHGSENKKGNQVWELSWYYGENDFQARAKKRRRTGDDDGGAAQIIFYADPDEGKSIEFTQTGKEATPYYKLDGVQFTSRDYEITDVQIKNTHCLEDLLTN